MKSRLFIALAFAPLIATNARAEDDCALNGAAMASRFAPSPKAQVVSPAKLDKGGQVMEETIRLENGVLVTYSEGGCEHLAHSFSFRHAKGMPASKGAPLFDWMRRQIALVPLKEDEAFHRKDLLDHVARLQKAASDKKNWQDAKTLTVEDDGLTLILQLRRDGFDLDDDFMM